MRSWSTCALDPGGAASLPAWSCAPAVAGAYTISSAPPGVSSVLPRPGRLRPVPPGRLVRVAHLGDPNRERERRAQTTHTSAPGKALLVKRIRSALPQCGGNAPEPWVANIPRKAVAFRLPVRLWNPEHECARHPSDCQRCCVSPSLQGTRHAQEVVGVKVNILSYFSGNSLARHGGRTWQHERPGFFEGLRRRHHRERRALRHLVFSLAGFHSSSTAGDTTRSSPTLAWVRDMAACTSTCVLSNARTRPR